MSGPLLASLLALASMVGPAVVDDPLDRILRAKTIRCVFDLGTLAEWKDGAPVLSTEPVHFGEGGTITFDSITSKYHTAGPCELPLAAPRLGHARLIGIGGGEDVFVIFTVGALSFVETTFGGTVNVTTIFFEYQKPGTRDYFAVMSRHVNGLGALAQPMPSQYHGTCRVMP